MENAELKLKSKNSLADFLSSRWLQVGGIMLIGLLLLLLSGGLGSEPESQPTGEGQLEEICSMMEGVGECRVLITYHPDDSDRVYAVLLLCEGADSPQVRKNVTSLLCSLYGIGSNRVEIGRLNK